MPRRKREEVRDFCKICARAGIQREIMRAEKVLWGDRCRDCFMYYVEHGKEKYDEPKD